MLKKLFNKFRRQGYIKGGVNVRGVRPTYTESRIVAEGDAYKNEKISQERLNKIMQERHEQILEGSNISGANNTNKNSGNGSGGGDSDDTGGRMSPEEYLPGRLSSQFDYRSEGNESFKATSYDAGYQKSDYNIAREIISFRGGYIKIGIGISGGLYETYYDRNGKKPKRVKYDTYHLAGNHHIHPDIKDKSKDYYSKPKRWYGKDGLISKIIDKGPKKTK